jgi:hypothetical protein
MGSQNHLALGQIIIIVASLRKSIDILHSIYIFDQLE